MGHTYNFFRAGGFNQVRLASGADLLNLDQLDQKLWVALACPTQGLVFDQRTLEIIDGDGGSPTPESPSPSPATAASAPMNSLSR